MASVVLGWEPALSQGIYNRLRPIIHRQFAQDRTHVVLDRPLAYREDVNELLVGHTLADAFEDLEFPWRQRRKDGRHLAAVDSEVSKLLQDPGRDGRRRKDPVVDGVLAGRNAANRSDEVLRLDVLQNKLGGARPDRREEQI